GGVGEKCLLRRKIDKRRAPGEAIESTLILGTNQAVSARFLDHLIDTLMKGLTELFLVIILDAGIERIETFLSQLALASLAVARRRATTVEPHAVELILGDKLANEVKFPVHKLLPADAELPQVRPVSLVFGGWLGRPGAGTGLGHGGIG